MARPKYPEKMLGRAEIETLTGLAEAAVLRLFKTEWAKDAYMLCGKLALPVSAYNRWIDRCKVEPE